MVFEELRGGFMRVRANDHVSSHLVADIFDTALRDLLGLAEWSTHADDRALVFFDPRLPRGNSFAFLSAPLRFGKGVSCLHFCARFTAKENSEICVGRVHEVSFPLRFASAVTTRCRLQRGGASADRTAVSFSCAA